MAVDTEIISIDNVEKTLWDKIVNIATAFTANELTALSALAGIKTALAELAEDKTALAALAENISGETLDALLEMIESGGGVVYVPFEVTTDNALTVTTTADFSDVVAAAKAKKNVIGEIDFDGGLIIYAPLSISTPIDDPSVLQFVAIADFGGSDEPAAPALITIRFTEEFVGISKIELAVAT